MKFICNKCDEQFIIKYEMDMLEKYSRIINKYSPSFMKYGCFAEKALFWNNSLTKTRSYQRIELRNGYTCYIYCELVKDDKKMYIKSSDGEADHYQLSAIWPISSIQRFYFKTMVSLYSNMDEVENDIKELLDLLSGGNVYAK